MCDFLINSSSIHCASKRENSINTYAYKMYMHFYGLIKSSFSTLKEIRH